jgi:hypothetical protein
VPVDGCQTKLTPAGGMKYEVKPCGMEGVFGGVIGGVIGVELSSVKTTDEICVPDSRVFMYRV